MGHIRFGFVAVAGLLAVLSIGRSANATDQGIIWESTDSTVATVNALGLVTARGVGAGVFITAYTHDGHFQASVNVSVNP